MHSASQRRPLVAANWKMYKTVAETEDFLDRFLGSIGNLGEVDLVLCPPATALAAAVERTRRSPIRIAAQNVHEQEAGPFTGEISIPMLRELDVAGAVVGHSERRALFCETDEALARKVPALLSAELLPILCVGESEAERDAGETEAVLARQVDADLAAVPDPKLAGVVIAYEPIWAIGTGRTATTEQAQEAIALIRSRIAVRDSAVAARIRIVYGGSVKPGNAAGLFAQPDVDGGLVGGASLDPEDFLAICEAA
ncbi:MAG: triosephosphate isomerase [Solirubrobacterales bacterium]|jgi:triosephosphate isomerase|nr:triosephosphate isomerase [Solirubrobacterales bacterium]